jgi:hypothetical protein
MQEMLTAANFVKPQVGGPTLDAVLEAARPHTLFSTQARQSMFNAPSACVICRNRRLAGQRWTLR